MFMPLWVIVVVIVVIAVVGGMVEIRNRAKVREEKLTTFTYMLIGMIDTLPILDAGIRISAAATAVEFIRGDITKESVLPLFRAACLLRRLRQQVASESGSQTPKAIDVAGEHTKILMVRAAHATSRTLPKELAEQTIRFAAEHPDQGIDGLIDVGLSKSLLTEVSRSGFTEDDVLIAQFRVVYALVGLYADRI